MSGLSPSSAQGPSEGLPSTQQHLHRQDSSVLPAPSDGGREPHHKSVFFKKFTTCFRSHQDEQEGCCIESSLPRTPRLSTIADSLRKLSRKKASAQSSSFSQGHAKRNLANYGNQTVEDGQSGFLKCRTGLNAVWTRVAAVVRKENRQAPAFVSNADHSGYYSRNAVTLPSEPAVQPQEEMRHSENNGLASSGSMRDAIQLGLQGRRPSVLCRLQGSPSAISTSVRSGRRCTVTISRLSVDLHISEGQYSLSVDAHDVRTSMEIPCSQHRDRESSRFPDVSYFRANQEMLPAGVPMSTSEGVRTDSNGRTETVSICSGNDNAKVPSRYPSHDNLLQQAMRQDSVRSPSHPGGSQFNSKPDNIFSEKTESSSKENTVDPSKALQGRIALPSSSNPENSVKAPDPAIQYPPSGDFNVSKYLDNLRRDMGPREPFGSDKCQACLDFCEQADRFHCISCQNGLCKSCMSKHVSVAVLECNREYLPCPLCRFPLRAHEIIGELDPNSHVFDIMVGREYSRRFHRRLRYCSNHMCSAPFDWLEDQPQACGSSEIPKIKCPLCKYETCAECRTAWHHGQSCKEFQVRMKQSDLLEKIRSENGWQNCPNCNHLVDRRQGCNKVQCRCGMSFCFSCGLNDCACQS